MLQFGLAVAFLAAYVALVLRLSEEFKPIFGLHVEGSRSCL